MGSLLSETYQSFYNLVQVYATLGSTEGTLYYTNGDLTDQRYVLTPPSGNGGWSFGMTQLDASNNAAARSLFENLVDQAEVAGRITDDQGSNYIDQVESGGSLSSAAQNTIATEVLLPGAAQINQLDISTIANVAATVASVEDAVGAQWGSAGVLDPSNPDYIEALGLLASWDNRTGGLNTLQQFLTGGNVNGANGPLDPLTQAPTLSDLEHYFNNQTEFINNPDELGNVIANIDRGQNLFSDTGLSTLAGWTQELAKQGAALADNTLALSPLGAWISNHLLPMFSWGMLTGSPLVLDLSSGGTGVTLSAENGTGAALWDFGSQFLHQSGFVTGTTGILCIDPNGGPITQADLFGTEPVRGTGNGTPDNGFQALQEFAGMTGGVLDASNPVFNELYVWVPSVNQSTVTTPGAGELYTLAQLGITSINLNYDNLQQTGSMYQINGNDIEEQSTFVINGNTQSIVDAWFAYNPLNTIYEGNPTINPEVLTLPDQRGYGHLPDLAISMSTDSTLLGEVQNLANQSFSQLMNPSFGLESALRTIYHEWAGVENISATSEGPYVNAQSVEFLEHFMGQNVYNDISTLNYDWNAEEAAPIVPAYNVLFAVLDAHLLAQAGFSNLMGNPTYDPVSDALYVNGNPYDVAVQFADEAYESTLGHLATNDIFVLFPGDAPVSGNNPGLYIDETANGGGTNILALGVAPTAVTLSTDYNGNLYVHYTATDTVEIQATMVYNSENAGTAGGSTVGQYIQEIAFSDGTVENLTGGIHLTATSTYPHIYGTSVGGDTLDGSQITGAILFGTTGTETFIAGHDSTMNAGIGTNLYVINPDSCPASSGGATIDPNAHASGDQIVLHGVTESQVVLTDDYEGNLYISTAHGDLVTVTGGTEYDPWDNIGVGLGNVAGIHFDDGTVLSLTGVVPLTAVNAGSIYGVKTGTDFIADGNSNWFHGYNANDVFSFTPGSSPANQGGDTVQEYANLASQTIAFHGITPGAVTISDDNSGNLYLQFGTDLVTLAGGHFSNSAGFTTGNVEHATFDNGTVWNLQSGLDLTATTNGQYLYGTSAGGDTLTADGVNDYLYAYAGSDSLVAGNGANLYNGSGNDADVLSVGFNTATIYADASGGSSNSIVFHGVTASQLTLWDDTSGNLYIGDPSGDVATIHGGSYSSSTGFTPGNIHEIALDSGATINLTGGLNLTATGAWQALYGTGHGDSLTAQGFADSLYGIAGNNTMTGAASTLTYEYGGSGNDTFVDGGGTANNQWQGGTGADAYIINSASSSTTISGFSESKGDVLNVANILQGDDVLSNVGGYLQETQSGGNTQISIDPTGQGNFSNVPQIILHGVTGLESVSAMIADGHLLVHS